MQTDVYNEDVPAVAESKGSEKDKNLSCPPFLQNQKNSNQGSMQTKHTNGFQVIAFL